MNRPETRRRTVLALGALPLVSLSLRVLAQGAPPREGEDYQVLQTRIPVEPEDKIVVLDFFRYGCPHCQAFLAPLQAWEKRLAADVSLQHVPCAFSPDQEALSRVYFSLLALGRLGDLHAKVFDAVIVRRQRLEDPEDIAAFMATNGIPHDKWMSVYNSFSMGPSLRHARDMIVAYRIDGTPTLACDGRYLTAPSMMQSASSIAEAHDRALAVLDYLIAKVRAERRQRHK